MVVECINKPTDALWIHHRVSWKYIHETKYMYTHDHQPTDSYSVLHDMTYIDMYVYATVVVYTCTTHM